jgi:N-acetylmuramoyl-L-alanine amidase
LIISWAQSKQETHLAIMETGFTFRSVSESKSVLPTRVLASRLFWGVLLWGAVPGFALAAAPVAVAAHVEPGARETRLVFALDACVSPETYVLDAPARAIVDLPEVNFQIDPGQGGPAPQPVGRHGDKPRSAAKPRPAASATSGLIASYRFGRLAPGKSRIVIDLASPAEIVATSCAPAKGAGFELAFTLAPQPEPAFKAAARDGSARQARMATSSATPSATPAQAPSEKPVVVIDPGHGGVDSGALGGNHAVEKTIVLEFARALAVKLREGDRYQVVLTRDDDTFVPLGERVRIARKLSARLFVSVHADALRGGGADGATVYTVSEKASDAEAARVAESENQADADAGAESKEDADDVNDILFDLTRRETRAFSHVFARSLSDYWKVAARLNKNPRRSAGFVVLKAPDVPSVLLELGYLSSAKDAADLSSPQWRDRASAQVAHAIDSFFAAKLVDPASGAALKPTQSIGN